VLTQVQRFAISTTNAIGGLDVQNLGVSTIDVGYTLNCYGKYYDGGNVYRTTGGTLNMLRSSSNSVAYYNKFYTASTSSPWASINFQNGYFEIEDTTLLNASAASSLNFTDCLDIYLGNYASINAGYINFLGTSNRLSTLIAGNTSFNAQAVSGTVIDTTSLTTITNAYSLSFSVSGNSNQSRTVILPPANRYTAGSIGAQFYDDAGVGTLTISNNNPLLSALVFNDGGTKVFSSLYVQGYLRWSTATNISGSNLYILGTALYTDSPYALLTGSVNTFNLPNIYVGDTSTQYPINLQFGTQDLSNTVITINAGVVSMLPNGKGVQKISNVVVNSVAGASSSTVLLVNSATSYSTANNITIKSLTVSNTGTINVDPATILISESGSTSTWDLGSRTFPKVLINPGSNISIIDAANSNTTYIKEISYGAGATSSSLGSFSISYNSQGVYMGGGTISHSYNAGTGELSFSLYGGGSVVNGQTINLYYNITVAGSVNFAWNTTVSSESGFDFGSLIIGSNTWLSISGSNNSVGSNTLTSGTYLINLRYTKDGSQTVGSDRFSGSVVFTGVAAVAANSTATYLRFHSGRTFTFDKFFHDATTPNYPPLTIASTQTGTQTLLVIPTANLGTLVQGADPGGVTTATIIDCAVTSTDYIWFAGKNSIDGGNNLGWIFGASPNSQTAVQFLL
jgi:hypothetical protein